ncbi:MAG: hypothetical protein ABIR06_20155 [Cyclobacteriaceae bacterium]
MSLNALVKVSRISNLSDARYCSGMGVEMLGFRVIPGQEDYIPPELFQEIRGWVSGPKIIAELYGITSADEIGFIIQTYAPDYFELTYAEFKAFGTALSLPCIVYLPSEEITTVTSYDNTNFFYLLVGEQTTCKDLPGIYPALIKITSLDKLHEKLSNECFAGFVLESSKQSRPGVTNYDQLGNILEALEVDGN